MCLVGIWYKDSTINNDKLYGTVVDRFFYLSNVLYNIINNTI